MIVVDLLEHLIASIAVLDHAEGLGMLTALISRRFGHRLGTLSISFVLSRLVSLSGCKFILSHERVKLLSEHRCVVQLMAIRLFHCLKVICSVHLTQIDGLIGASLRHATRDRQAFAERHGSHVLAASCVPITESTRRADQVFHTFLRGRWGCASIAVCNCLASVIRGQYHMLDVPASVPLPIPQAVITTLMRRLLSAELRFLIRP